jgi:RNA polymerase sigma factor (sigma-70 family)
VKNIYETNYIAGGVATVEVKGDWAEELKLFDYEMKQNDRRETRRHIYISNLPLGAEQLIGYEPDPLDAVCMMETNVEIAMKLDTLTDRQRQVLRLRTQGLKEIEIAKKIGITQQAVSKVMKTLEKKFSQQVVK